MQHTKYAHHVKNVVISISKNSLFLLSAVLSSKTEIVFKKATWICRLI